ncbi:hypothetical protein FS837_010044 [Tulasnella sp. UAMH 9824]|nr:hypothetical protein FS837_010044 [Tulasnella sp. UAMH 9824]
MDDPRSVSAHDPDHPELSSPDHIFSNPANATKTPPGLSSQLSTPAKPLSNGLGQPTKHDVFSFRKYDTEWGITVSNVTVDHRVCFAAQSPAAKRIPAVDTAETNWEAARRAVAQKMELLAKVQAECDEAVRLERQAFKAYSEARTNFDE